MYSMSCSVRSWRPSHSFDLRWGPNNRHKVGHFSRRCSDNDHWSGLYFLCQRGNQQVRSFGKSARGKDFASKMDSCFRWFMEMITTDDEMIFGGGEQYTYLNLRGRDYPMWVREQVHKWCLEDQLRYFNSNVFVFRDLDETKAVPWHS